MKFAINFEVIDGTVTDSLCTVIYSLFLYRDYNLQRHYCHFHNCSCSFPVWPGNIWNKSD